MDLAHRSVRINNHPKHQIAHRFGHASTTYNTQAWLQHECAQHLLETIKSYQSQITTGTILEIGCGTGFITQGLINLFPHHPLHITDISPGMVEFCKSHLQVPEHQHDRISFSTMDGERIDNIAQRYGAIVGGFVIQWFSDWMQGVKRLVNQLQPGGYLFLSFPTDQSFSEWQHVCEQNNIPFTANSLPNPECLQQALPTHAQIRHIEITEYCTTHPRAIDFFRGLKAIGATVNLAEQQLSLRQMKQLIQTWDRQSPNQIQVHYQIAFCVIQRDD